MKGLVHMRLSLSSTCFWWVLLLCCAMPGRSQTYTYSLNITSGSYSPISTGTVVTELFAGADDEISGLYNIGFTFFYGLNCVGYTQFKVSANGWLTFNTGAATGDPTNDLGNNATMRPGLAPLWDDLALNWAATPVRALLSGTSPNQVLTVQWSQASWKITGANPGQMSFQIKLYESSNVIEFIYHQESGALASPSASIGLAAAATGSGNYYSMNGTLTGASKTVNTQTINIKPSEGAIYQWTPDCLTMPVELLSFGGLVAGKENILSWTTGSEKFNDYFTLERSANGVVYQEVKCIAGAGNSENERHYEVIDECNCGGLVYYRLKQTDLNGEHTYYPAITLEPERIAVKVYPNPGHDVFLATFEITEESLVKYAVKDILGKTILRSDMLASAGVNGVPFDLSRNPTGTYYFEVETPMGVYRDKLVKY